MNCGIGATSCKRSGSGMAQEYWMYFKLFRCRCAPQIVDANVAIHWDEGLELRIVCGVPPAIGSHWTLPLTPPL